MIAIVAKSSEAFTNARSWSMQSFGRLKTPGRRAFSGIELGREMWEEMKCSKEENKEGGRWRADELDHVKQTFTPVCTGPF